MTGRSLLLFALEPDGEMPIALRQAARALRRLNEAPPPVPALGTESAPAAASAAAVGRPVGRSLIRLGLSAAPCERGALGEGRGAR